MTDIWSYQSTEWTSDEDLVGYDVEATDGSIGKVDEASGDAGRQHVVVDTGFWIFGKKRLIPAGAIKRISHDEEKVFVSLTKDQIKEPPISKKPVATTTTARLMSCTTTRTEARSDRAFVAHPTRRRPPFVEGAASAVREPADSADGSFARSMKWSA